MTSSLSRVVVLEMTLKLLRFKGIILGYFMQTGVSSNLFQSRYIFSKGTEPDKGETPLLC